MKRSRVPSPRGSGLSGLEGGPPVDEREGLLERLFAPVDIASLMFFRVVFGAVMLWEVLRYYGYGWIGAYHVDPVFHFSYYGFRWAR